MNKYKVEINRTQSFVVDVLADNESEAEKKATEAFAIIKDSGMEHYHENRDSVEETGAIYDVTNTDDPHDPQ